jgi:hypothetical protein
MLSDAVSAERARGARGQQFPRARRVQLIRNGVLRRKCRDKAGSAEAETTGITCHLQLRRYRASSLFQQHSAPRPGQNGC